MHQIFVANHSNLERAQKLILLIKRGFVKKLLYSGNFKVENDYWHGQKVNVCLFICINKLWLLNLFFFFNAVLE